MILSFDPAKIWCLCFDFHLDPAIEINFSLKSELHVMFLLRFLLRSVIFAQIWVWWVDFQLRSGENPVTIGENPVIDCQYEADRPDRCPPESDLTRPEVVCGWRRVVQPFTRWKRVGCGLGINPTRTDPWTPLVWVDKWVWVNFATPTWVTYTSWGHSCPSDSLGLRFVLIARAVGS